LETHYPYSRYLREVFGGKTYKIVVASGLTCPTRDGKLASAGCAFCDLRGSSSFFGKKGRGRPVREQIEARLPEIRARFSAEKFLAYFQSYTNTYTGADELRELYESALAVPEIAGLCIGTRPDCLEDDVLSLLEELGQRTYVSLELGVQSFEDASLEWLARGHDGACSVRALERLAQRCPSVHVCAHLMFGQPTDSRHCARDAARLLSLLGVRGAKLHQLMILEGTELARRYRAEPFPTLSLEEYGERVIEFIEYLSPSIYLERLCANATHKDECLAPQWSRERWRPHNVLREMLETRGCRQGSKLLKSEDPVMAGLPALDRGVFAASNAQMLAGLKG
jgi:radical SAM protein (TIGR01212 family)